MIYVYQEITLNQQFSHKVNTFYIYSVQKQADFS